MAAAFDPAALAAAPDGGAALLEALMHGAARAGDAPLLIQIAAAAQLNGLRLSGPAHRALLHVLCKAGRFGEAGAWLQERVAPGALTWEVVAAVARPAEQAGETAALRAALDLADRRAVPDPDLGLAGARLALAAADGGVDGVARCWEGLVAGLAAHGARPGPALLARRLFALHGMRAPADTHAAMMAGAEELLGALEAARAQQQQQQEQEQQQEQQEQQGSAAAQDGNASPAAFAVWGSAAEQWLPGGPGAQPGPAAGAGCFAGAPLAAPPMSADEEAAVKALDAAAGVAAKMLDGAGVARLGARRAALGLPPTAQLYRALLNMATWGRGTPEDCEALLAEMLGWGIAPDLRCYEALIDAHAHHGDGAAAVRVLDRLEAAGLAATHETYRRLLHGLGATGDLRRAAQVYARLRATGVAPDSAILGRLFRVVRNHAQLVRTESSRRKAALPGIDAYGRRAVDAERSARLAEAYVQLLAWQGDMVAGGIRHNSVTLSHLLGALERLNAVSDCVRLAQLHEHARPGDLQAHRLALKAAGRMRTPAAAGHTQQLAARLREGGSLSREEYLVLLFSQFWLHNDKTEVSRTLEAMKRDGFTPDEPTSQGLLHLFCSSGSWPEALAVMDQLEEAAAAAQGGAAPAARRAAAAAAAAGYWAGGRGGADAGAAGSTGPAVAVAAGGEEGQEWRQRRYPAPALAPAVAHAAPTQRQQHQQQHHHHHHHGGRGGGAPGRYGLGSDALWHVVLRQLSAQNAPDGVTSAFLARMSRTQLARFKRMYPIRQLPDGSYSVLPDHSIGATPAKMRAGAGKGAGAGADPSLLGTLAEAVAAAEGDGARVSRAGGRGSGGGTVGGAQRGAGAGGQAAEAESLSA